MRWYVLVGILVVALGFSNAHAQTFELAADGDVKLQKPEDFFSEPKPPCDNFFTSCCGDGVINEGEECDPKASMPCANGGACLNDDLNKCTCSSGPGEEDTAPTEEDDAISPLMLMLLALPLVYLRRRLRPVTIR